MKAALFRKSDNVGAAVGHLCAPDELQYEDQGKIGKFHLSGSVVDTEYYDVLVVGIKVSDTEISVQRMESLPKEGDGILKFCAEGADGKVFCVACPDSMITEVKERYSEKGVLYHNIRITGKEKKSVPLVLSVLGEFSMGSGTGSHVFLLKEAPRRDVKQFGSGYAVKNVVTDYASGYQILS